MKAKISKTFIIIDAVCNFCKTASTGDKPLRMIRAGFLNICENCVKNMSEYFS